MTIARNQLAALNRIATVPGTYVVNDNTAEEDLKFHAFYVAEDTTIASLSVNGGNTVNVVGDYISTPGTALKAGVIVSCRQGYFSAIQLSGGSVSLILLPNTLQ